MVVQDNTRSKKTTRNASSTRDTTTTSSTSTSSSSSSSSSSRLGKTWLKLVLCIALSARILGVLWKDNRSLQALAADTARSASAMNLDMNGLWQWQWESSLGSTNAANAASPSPSPITSFLPKQEDLDFCSQHNFIPQSSEQSETGLIEKNANNTRPFSIRYSDFLPHHSSGTGTGTESGTGYCSSVQELGDAIRYGTRQWDSSPIRSSGGTQTDERLVQNMSLLEREQIPSTFIPHGCDVPLYSPSKMCRVLNRFSHIIVQGDSLARHLQGGILMGLRNDLIRGSLVQTVPSSYFKCRCDAQFSEHPTCRGHAPLYNRYKPFELGLCPELDVEDQFESVFNINRLHRGVYKLDGVNCTEEEGGNTKGILVIAQGGIHLGHDAGGTYNMILQKFLQDPIFRSCAKQKKAFLVWTSYQAQSESYQELYPLQSLRVGIPFNEKIKEFIERDKIENLAIMDWLNFTTGGQHTDGLHFAAHINYFKAQHLVAMADLMWQENKTVDYPQLYS